MYFLAFGWKAVKQIWNMKNPNSEVFIDLKSKTLLETCELCTLLYTSVYIDIKLSYFQLQGITR